MNKKDKFVKITESMYENDIDISKHLCERVSTFLTGNKVDNDIMLDESLLDCESPIEQMLALGFANIGLELTNLFNPFVDIITIEKQKEIICGKSKYRVDFFIPVHYSNREPIGFIVECDGHEFHQKTKEQVERDNARMRDLQKAGYEVIRFSGTEIWNRPIKCALEVLRIVLSKCKYEQ